MIIERETEYQQTGFVFFNEQILKITRGSNNYSPHCVFKSEPSLGKLDLEIHCGSLYTDLTLSVIIKVLLPEVIDQIEISPTV